MTAPHSSQNPQRPQTSQPPQPPPFYRPRKSALHILFSSDFSDSVTLRVVKVAYRAVIALTVLSVLFWIWFALALPDWMGWIIKLLICIASPIMGIVFLGFVRMGCEYIIAMQALNGKVHDLDRKVDYLARNTWERSQRDNGKGST
ncbi:DUF4282 domain-containing protein [Actinomadura sp. 9N215]|uniref:DUF4282 domain-containing protein n=1 Tax=Actinomadura sp. 9N215 TaxID=3375150 RepID=UPI00378B682E